MIGDLISFLINGVRTIPLSQKLPTSMSLQALIWYLIELNRTLHWSHNLQSGKSTYLRQVALLTIQAHAGTDKTMVAVFMHMLRLVNQDALCLQRSLHSV